MNESLIKLRQARYEIEQLKAEKTMFKIKYELLESDIKKIEKNHDANYEKMVRYRDALEKISIRACEPISMIEAYKLLKDITK